MDIIKHNQKLILLLALLILAVFIAPFTPEWDLKTARFFYNSTDREFYTNKFIRFIFDFAALPALFIGIGSALLYLASFLYPKLRRNRACYLYLALVLAIGGGFITHTLLKDHWGRPRPRQVKEFGGELEFRPFYKPNFNSEVPAKSFPCGHCTTGFYFFSFIFLGRRLGNNFLVYIGAVLTLVLGSALGYVRMAEGGHFLTDVFFGAVVMFTTAYLFDKYYLAYELGEYDSRQRRLGR